MEGGEDLELSPSQKTRVRYQFEAFCTKVLKDEKNDFNRAQKRRAKKEVYLSTVPADVLEELSVIDDYPVEQYAFEVCGERLVIHNDKLAEVLLELGTEAYSILLLAYCLDLSDREIAELLGASRSTIQRRRQRLLAAVKKQMKG